MRNLAVLTALVLAIRPVSAAAQSDILLQLRSGAPAGDRFRVDSAGGVLALGDLGSGVIPATGPGDRMMWYPFKAAFRAGSTTGGAGTEWDDANVGFYSWAGGDATIASGTYSFAMGTGTEASGARSVAMGTQTTASGTNSFTMGENVTASAPQAIAIGTQLTANANYAIVLGRYASSGGMVGSFTWADGSTTAYTYTNQSHNSFQIRASGGVKLFTNPSATVGVGLSSGGSSWNVLSDRSRKRDFEPVDGEDVLSRIRGLPVTTWVYIDEVSGVRHIGPMAQDWHAAFGFGEDDTTINMSDLDGVNLAAVKALERRTADLQAQLAERNVRIADLEARIARMESLLTAPR